MHFDLWTFIWAFANFFIMLAILNKFLYKPLLSMLEERKNTIAQSLQQAEEIKVKSAKIQAEFDQKLEEARKESQGIIERATKMGEQLREEMVSNAKAEAEKTLKKAQDQITREKDAALASLRTQVATLAVMAAGKVLDKTISVDDHEKMVQDFVDEVGDMKC